MYELSEYLIITELNFTEFKYFFAVNKIWKYVMCQSAYKMLYHIHLCLQESQTKLINEPIVNLEINKVVLGGDFNGSVTHFHGYLECFQIYDTKLSLNEMKGLQFCPNRHGKWSLNLHLDCVSTHVDYMHGQGEGVLTMDASTKRGH